MFGVLNSKTVLIAVVLVSILASGGRVNAADSTYCVDNSTLHIAAKPNVTVGDTVISFDAEEVACQYGCYDQAWIALGSPACGESPMFSLAVAIAIILVVAALIVWWLK